LSYLLSLDQGTSSTRAIAYSKDGQAVASFHVPIECTYPHPGWVELDTEVIWSSTLKALSEVLTQISPSEVIGLGLTNQRETTILWEKKTGKTIGPALVWQDRRTESLCLDKKNHAPMVHEKTGLHLDPYFSASKIEWQLQQNPELKKKAKQGDILFGTIDTYLLWRLTQGQAHKTDVTNASRTLLLNLKTLNWDNDLLELFNIPQQMLPEVVPSDAHFGLIHPSFFGVEIPIHGMIGDQQAALLGQAGVEPGMIKATYGTGGFLLLNTGQKIIRSQQGLITTLAYQIQNEIAYGLEGSMYQAGAIVKWLEEGLGLIEKPEDSETLANTLTSNDGVYLVPAFTGLGAPYWVNHAGGVLTGLTRRTTKAHIARAALEAIVYQTKDILTCMRKESLLNLKTLRVDGGVSNNPWFLSYLAQICEVVVQKPADLELTAKGAALTAALGLGVIPNLKAITASWQSTRAYMPSDPTAQDIEAYAGWEKAVQIIIDKAQ
jgi:glycerol kinase